MPCSGEAGEMPASRLELALRLAPRLVGQRRLLDPAAELGDLAAALFVLAELALNGSELLAQVVLALRLGEPLLGVGRDLPAQLAHGELALQQVDQSAELGRDRVHLEELLPRGQVERNQRRDEVGHVAGIGELSAAARARRAAPRDASTSRRKMSTTARRSASTSVAWTIWSCATSIRATRYGSVPTKSSSRIRSMPWTIRRTLPSGTRRADGSRPRCRPGGGPRAGRLRLRIALGHQRQKPVAAHDIVDEPNGARLPYRERRRGQREHDRVPERQDGECVGDDEVRGAGAGLDGHQPASHAWAA